MTRRLKPNKQVEDRPLNTSGWRRVNQTILKCKQCDDEFIQQTPWQLYCKPYCKLKALRQRKKEGIK